MTDGRDLKTRRKPSAEAAEPRSSRAIYHYEPHAGQLSNEERKRRLEILDRVVAAIPQRPASEVDKELRQLRNSRRSGWQRNSRRER